MVVITSNELVMSTKCAKTTSIKKCILPKQHLYNNYIQGKPISVLLFDIFMEMKVLYHILNYRKTKQN